MSQTQQTLPSPGALRSTFRYTGFTWRPQQEQAYHLTMGTMAMGCGGSEGALSLRLRENSLCPSLEIPNVHACMAEVWVLVQHVLIQRTCDEG
jgi:hypothetical protein